MMKRLLCAAALIALITPQAALAQDHHGKGNHGGGHQAARPQRQAARPQRQQAPRQQRAPARAVHVTRTTEVRRAAPMQRQTERTVRTTRVTRQTRAAPVTRQVVQRRTQVQARTRRPAGYRPAHVQRVRATTYRYPRGYSYRRYRSGSILPSIFRSRAYYYTNWYDLGFGPPPPGYAWVRYGPDLLLVNIYTGRIRDVAYGVFY